MDFGAQLRDFLAQGPYQDHQLRGVANRATDLYQLAVYDKKGKRLVSHHPGWKNQQLRVWRSLTQEIPNVQVGPRLNLDGVLEFEGGITAAGYVLGSPTDEGGG
jgi:hypothetical protein